MTLIKENPRADTQPSLRTAGGTIDPGLVHQVVRVAFDARQLRLKVSPSKVTVLPGNVVICQFADVPQGWRPWIRFVPQEQGLGPFRDLAEIPGGLWGTVTDLAAGRSFAFRAAIQVRYAADRADEPAVIQSEQCELTVGSASAAKAASSTLITRDVLPGQDGSFQLLVDPPETIVLAEGDAVRWRFDQKILDGSSEPLKPRIEFTEYTPKEEGSVADLAFGPFTSVSYASLTAPELTIVTATGYAQNPSGTYNYRAVAFRESTGEVVWASSTDPVIDDPGPPG